MKQQQSPTSSEFTGVKAAIRAANLLRAKGLTVKVFKHQGVYCQPGVGLASYCYFTVELA